MTKKVIITMGGQMGFAVTYDARTQAVVGHPDTMIKPEYVPHVLCQALIALAEQIGNKDVLEVPIDIPSN